MPPLMRPESLQERIKRERAAVAAEETDFGHGRISKEPRREAQGEGGTSLELFRTSICVSGRPSCSKGSGREDFLKLLG